MTPTAPSLALIVWLFTVVACTPARQAPSGSEGARTTETYLQLYSVGQTIDVSPNDCASAQRQFLLQPKSETLDPWNTPIQLRCSAGVWSLTSAGPDRAWRTTDDLALLAVEIAEEKNRPVD